MLTKATACAKFLNLNVFCNCGASGFFTIFHPPPSFSSSSAAFLSPSGRTLPSHGTHFPEAKPLLFMVIMQFPLEFKYCIEVVFAYTFVGRRGGWSVRRP